MNIKLFFQAIIKFILGVLIIGLLLFIPANTINYWNGWIFMGLLFIPMFIAGIVLMIKSPELLKKRLNAKEKENEQKQVVALSGLMFLAGFIIAGLNYRYNWIKLPDIVVIIASIVFTYGLWQDNVRITRICIAITEANWTIYNIVVRAYAGALQAGADCISALIALVRYKQKNIKQTKTE